MTFLRSFQETKAGRVADQVHDTGLGCSVREHRADGVGKAREPVHHRDQDMLTNSGAITCLKGTLDEP